MYVIVRVLYVGLYAWYFMNMKKYTMQKVDTIT